MTKKEILKLLKSGNFTIAYHDNRYCCLYKGHKSYEKCEREVASFQGADDGYIENIVAVLTEALGGKVETI